MKKLSFLITAMLLLSLVGFSQPTISPSSGNYTVCPGEGISYSPMPGSTGCGQFTWTVTKGSFTYGSSTTTIITTGADQSVTVYWNDVAETGKLSYSTTCNKTPISVTQQYAIRSLNGQTPANARISQGQQYPFCSTVGISLQTDVLFLLNTGGTTGITQQRADGYEWSLPSGWSASGTTGTVTSVTEFINIEPTNGCSGGTATVRAFMSCGSGRKYSNSTSISLARPTPTITLSAPASYTGPTCGNQNPVTFTATAIPCASDYRWVFPSGWHGSAPSPVSTGADNFITLTPSGDPSDAGNITVTITLNCGTQFVKSIPLTFQGPVISSPDLVCAGSQVTMLNVSESVVVNWNVSANMSINQGQGTRNIIVGPLNATSDGSGMISATTNCPNTTVANKSLWIGKPVYQQFTFDGEMVPIICEGLYQPFTGGEHVLTAIPGGTTSSPTFSLQTSSPYVRATKVGNNYNISVSIKNQNFEFLVRTSVSNGCGTKQTCTYFTNWASRAVSISYPNPASSEVTVEVGNPGSKKILTLYTSGQEQVFNTVTTEESASIDTSKLPNGTYILKITEGDKTRSQRLIVKH